MEKDLGIIGEDEGDLLDDPAAVPRAMMIGIVLGSLLWIVVIAILWTVGLAIMGG